MKKILFKSKLIKLIQSCFSSFIIVLLVGCFNNAFADLLAGSLGMEAEAIDRYRVICSAGETEDTGRLATRVSNTVPGAPLTSVQAYRRDQATNSTDAVSGDADFSPFAVVYEGNGTYFVAVDKAGIGAADYSLQVQCETNQGFATGTSINLLQDQ